MNSIALVTLLACTALLAPDEAAAVPRGSVVEPDPQTPEQAEARRLQTAEDMASWLPRLVGRFRIQGILGGGSPVPIPVTGAADCISVGQGPGVQCVVNAVWGAVGNSFLGPALILYGMEPNASMIRYLQLNTDGLVRDGPAVLAGDTLSWWCQTRDTPHVCDGLNIRLRASPDRKFVQMTFYTERSIVMDLDMRRVPQVQQGKVSKAAPAQRER